MRSVILWLLWMVYWIVLAAGTPSFFPDWVQAMTWAIGGTGCVLLIAWAKHVEVLNTRITAKDEDLKRLEAKITGLEKQLLSQPTSPPQSLLEPVRVIEVSESKEEALKLLPAVSSRNDPSQMELKVQALQTANAIYQVIEDAKRQARKTTGGLDIGVHLLYERPNDLRVLTYKNIVDSILNHYSEHLHDTAVGLKAKILAPDRAKFLPIGNYTNPQGLRDLEAITKDLKDIGTSPSTQS